MRSLLQGSGSRCRQGRGFSRTHGPCELFYELVETGGERYLELVHGSGQLKPCTRSLGGNPSNYIFPLEGEP